MPIICKKCNHENRDGKFFCSRCGEQIQEDIKSKYRFPVKMLKEMADNLVTHGTTQEKIEERFKDFINVARDLIDETHKDMEDKFSNVEDMVEKLASIGEESPQERSGEIVEKFTSRFQTAQDCINEGIFLTGESLKSIAGLSDIETGQGKKDLERALRLMETGLNNLEFINESLEGQLYIYKQVEPLPKKLTEAVTYLQKITLNISEYTDKREYDLLPETISLVDDMKE
ncbi:MAG: zinc ribbon domain-containing protein, partial [Candidatus Eremiobacterota bacterium]